MMIKKISLVIADDHALIRSGLKQALAAESAFVLLAEATNGEEALTMIQQYKPQIAILDVDMPKRDGFSVAKKVIADDMETEIIFLTMFSDEQFFNEAMDLGVKGYVLKENAIDEIVQCVNTVSLGEPFISPSLTGLLMKRRIPQSDPLGSLTPAERSVMRFVAEMKTSQQIADELFISIRTVNNHRTNISSKLGLSGAHALLKYALEHKDKL